MKDTNPNIAAFAAQGLACRAMGSELTATILIALSDVNDLETVTGRRIAGWPADPLADALPLRLAGGLHALARSGRAPELAALYAGVGDPAEVLKLIIAKHDDWLEPWLASPPQTNEVMRSAALMAGLMMVSARFNQPIDLFEMGASAGLNLNLDRFAYRLGNICIGDPASAVKIQPEWIGCDPPAVSVTVLERSGVDLRPINVSDDANVERLAAYIWPDQTSRLARLEAAIAVARAFPPQIVKGDAAIWITKMLQRAPKSGITRVIMQSVFWQYLPQVTQQTISNAINAGGDAASEDHPLAWIRFEPGASLYEMSLTIQCWPTGDTHVLATCHPHCATIRWL